MLLLSFARTTHRCMFPFFLFLFFPPKSQTSVEAEPLLMVVTSCQDLLLSSPNCSPLPFPRVRVLPPNCAHVAHSCMQLES